MISQKIQRRVDKINETLGTEYKATTELIAYRPPFLDFFNEIGRGEIRIFNRQLMSYAKYRHKTGTLKIYGFTWSRNFMGLRWGLTWLHIRFPKYNKNCITVYNIDGLGIDRMSSKTTRHILSNKMQELGIYL